GRGGRAGHPPGRDRQPGRGGRGGHPRLIKILVGVPAGGYGGGSPMPEKLVPRACRTQEWRLASDAHSAPSSSPDGSDSYISLHSGQTGNFFGSRLGTQTFPHSALMGVPNTAASIISFLST